ncbi:MAG TPA: hypothetical protein VK721_11100 [Solirubrobacteraceae bacterium]|nr:hypothetical protein [Solirubrobacteraceae bacterium]
MAFVRLALVAAYDRPLGALDRKVGRRTFFAALHPAEAGEVLILPAEFASMTSVAKTLAADAEKSSLQVVVVFVGAVAADSVPVEHLLYVVEGRAVDQGVVASLALDAIVGDNPRVVVVAEHAVDHAASHRFAGPLVAASGAQTGILKDARNGRDGVVAGRGQIEGELHQGGPIIVYGNGSDLAPVDVFTDVAVADTGHADRATVEELAFESDLDLLAIIARAEGVDAGHDRERQESLRAVVDWLAGGSQLRAVALYLSQQPEGVGLLAGNP